MHQEIVYEAHYENHDAILVQKMQERIVRNMTPHMDALCVNQEKYYQEFPRDPNVAIDLVKKTLDILELTFEDVEACFRDGRNEEDSRVKGIVCLAVQVRLNLDNLVDTSDSSAQKNMKIRESAEKLFTAFSERIKSVLEMDQKKKIIN